MKRFGAIFFFLAILTSGAAQAQGLKNLFNKEALTNAVASVIPTKMTVKELAGTWIYTGAACQFQSDNLLKNAGGAVASTQIETKMDELLTKIGVTNGKLSYTFAEDSTFTGQLGSIKQQGTFSLNEAGNVMTFHYKALKLPVGKSDVTIVKAGNNIKLLYHVDHLLDLLKLLGKTGNATLGAIGSLAGQYDGLLLGFELQKQ